jgi:hypothetical protein
MCEGVTSENNLRFFGVNIGIDPSSLCRECFLICFKHLQCRVHMITLMIMIVVYPVCWLTEKKKSY